MSVDHVRVIERAWLAYRDRQIFQILTSVLSVGSHENNCHLLLQRLSPVEARLFNAKTAEVKLRLAGETFPPKVVFKVALKNSAVCYLNGRNEIKKDVKGSIQMMGERNFYAQLTSDLIERQKNRKVVDEIDIGTEQDRIRFKNYQDQSIARIGGKDNQWRSVDLQNLPKAAPIRDLFELIEAKQLSALPRQFWTMPKNRNHFEKQVMLLLTENRLIVPKPQPAKKRTKSAKSSASERTERYIEMSAGGYPSARGPKRGHEVNVISIETDDFDQEARELYEWSQFL